MNVYQAILLVTSLGWWKNDPFKGCWWPPIGDDSRSRLESPGIFWLLELPSTAPFLGNRSGGRLSFSCLFGAPERWGTARSPASRVWVGMSKEDLSHTVGRQNAVHQLVWRTMKNLRWFTRFLIHLKVVQDFCQSTSINSIIPVGELDAIEIRIHVDCYILPIPEFLNSCFLWVFSCRYQILTI